MAAGGVRSSTVSVLMGNGDGTFQAKTDDAAGPSPTSVKVGDFNGDGRPDLAVLDTSVDRGGEYPPRPGQRPFGAPITFAVEPNPTSLAVADFDGDGRSDVAVSDSGGIESSRSTLTVPPAHCY